MGQKQILKGVDKAHTKAFYMERDLCDLKLVMMSDHHRGSKDGADDFLPCEQTYIKALNYYLQRDYTL
ncbi:MAG: hypothetical protein KTR13_01570, partial [Saprospiraceae bacterium]|nr:hypothetical protein [Saprospiraceae bacterium]